MTGKKISSSFIVGEAELTDVDVPQRLVDRHKRAGAETLGREIENAIPDLWKSREDVNANTTVYEATVYVFTLAQLKEYKQQIIAATKRGAFDEQEVTD